MPGTMVEFRGNERMEAGYLALPQGSARGPGVLVIQEWWGLVDHIKRVADRFAAAGFVALAPDLYHGESTTHPDEAGRRMMALDIAASSKELRGAADFLLAHDRVAPRRVAALGFCMGGQLALHAACEHPTVFAAAVDFYGIHPAVSLRVENLQCAVLAHFGESDGFVKVDDAKALVDRIATAGKTVESHFYPAGHAFFNDARPEAYDAPSAQLAWDRTLAFLRAELV